jgi:RND superfamily putative drug exporter
MARRLGLLVVVAFWLGLAGVGGPLVGRLAEVAENDNASFLPESAESTQVSELAAGFSDSEVFPYFVLAESASGEALTEAQVEALSGWRVGLDEVEVPGAGGDVVGAFLSDEPAGPASEPVQLADDGRAALVLVPLDAAAADRDLPSGESAVFGVAQALRLSLDEQVEPEGLDAAVGGPAGVLADLVTAFSGIDGRLLQVTLVWRRTA